MSSTTGNPTLIHQSYLNIRDMNSTITDNIPDDEAYNKDIPIRSTPSRSLVNFPQNTSENISYIFRSK